MLRFYSLGGHHTAMEGAKFIITRVIKTANQRLTVQFGIGNSQWDVSIYDKKDDSSDKCSSDLTRVYGLDFARMGFVGWLCPVFHEHSKGGTEMRVSHPTRHVLSTAMRPARLFSHVAAGEQPSRTPQP